MTDVCCFEQEENFKKLFETTRFGEDSLVYCNECHGNKEANSVSLNNCRNCDTCLYVFEICSSWPCVLFRNARWCPLPRFWHFSSRDSTLTTAPCPILNPAAMWTCHLFWTQRWVSQKLLLLSYHSITSVTYLNEDSLSNFKIIQYHNEWKPKTNKVHKQSPITSNHQLHFYIVTLLHIHETDSLK